MRNQEEYSYISGLSKAFKEKDQFIERFIDVFVLEVFTDVKKFFDDSDYDQSMRDALYHFAYDIINAVESVLEKDQNYPEYRLQHEIENISKLMSSVLAFIDEDRFLQQLHLVVKKMISNYYPEVVELGSYGFLLLERNTKLYTAGFISNIKQKELI